MKKLLFAATCTLAVTACSPVGVTKPVRGDEFKAFKDENMLTFVYKRFVKPKQAGVPAASGSLHPSFKDVLFVDWPTRVATVGPISVTAYRPYDEAKGFCESQGYQFVPSPARDPESDERPWPYLQAVQKYERQFLADMKQVGFMNSVTGYFQERARRWGVNQVPVTPSMNQKTNLKYMRTRVYRQILPEMVQEGAVGEFDCMRKGTNGFPDHVWASVAIYPYRVYPTIDPDFGRMHFAITVYQSAY
jgi:hypothetical protein